MKLKLIEGRGWTAELEEVPTCNYCKKLVNMFDFFWCSTKKVFFCRDCCLASRNSNSIVEGVRGNLFVHKCFKDCEDFHIIKILKPETAIIEE